MGSEGHNGCQKGVVAPEKAQFFLDCLKISESKSSLTMHSKNNKLSKTSGGMPKERLCSKLFKQYSFNNFGFPLESF